ncbi:hypothetical protein BC830DRAFT_1087249, partial [Chytriomyces sp. MP71]
MEPPPHNHIVATLICHLIESGVPKVSTSAPLAASFDRRLDALFSTVLIPLLNIPATTPSKKRARNAVSPKDTLNLLLILTQSSASFWSRNISTPFVLSLLDTHDQDPQTRLLRMRIALLHCESVASGSLDPRAEDSCASLVSRVLENRTESIDGAWDGTVEGVREENFGVAVWAAVVDHLVPVCHLASADQVESIVDTLVRSLKPSEMDAAEAHFITFKRLTGRLLQSVQFYELRQIRDILLSTLISAIVKTMESGLASPNKDAIAVLSLLAPLKSSKALTSLSPAIANLMQTHSMSMTTHISVKSDALALVTELIAVLNTFPTCYFTIHERDCLVGALFLLELIFANVPHAQRLSAMCRRITARFMESRDDTLLT